VAETNHVTDIICMSVLFAIFALSSMNTHYSC